MILSSVLLGSAVLPPRSRNRKSSGRGSLLIRATPPADTPDAAEKELTQPGRKPRRQAQRRDSTPRSGSGAVIFPSVRFAPSSLHAHPDPISQKIRSI